MYGSGWESSRLRHFRSPCSLPVLAVSLSVFLLAACSTNHQAAPPASLAPASQFPREQTAEQQVRQVLNRLAFGPRPSDAAVVRAMGVDQWIEWQLYPDRIVDTAASAFMAHYPTLRMSGAELFRDFPPRQALLKNARNTAPLNAADSAQLRKLAKQSNLMTEQLISSRVSRAVFSERQLEEVMVDFWENHFNVFSGKDRVRFYLPSFDSQVIRPNALGNFRELLGAVAKSEAMLYYLDNWQSVADSGRPVLKLQRVRARVREPVRASQRRRGLNENYARELMELHTLGVDGGYTQQDVIEVARALTGWTLDKGAQGGHFVFRPEMHDAGSKIILGRQFPAGKGLEEGEAVLDMLARSPNTARFIATKLARRFVSDTPPVALVDRASHVFLTSNGDIRQVVRTIVTSPEFFSNSAFRAKVKSPFELVISTLRALNAAPDSTARTAQVIARLGQPIFGHQAPNGYPETGDAWMNTGSILNRINFGMAAAGGRIPGISLKGWPGAGNLAGLPHDKQVEGVIGELFGGAVSTDTREVLLAGSNPFLTARSRNASTDSLFQSDSVAVNGQQPRSQRNSSVPSSQRQERRSSAAALAQTIGLALGSPEFQRR